MKHFTKFLIAIIISLRGLSMQAQQWSDVGNQGFTPSPASATSNEPDMVIFGNTTYVAYVTSTSQVVVMKYAAGTWTAMPTVATVGTTPDLAFDNSGTLYIVYQNSGASNVKKFDGANWVFVGSASINNTLGITGGLTPRIAINPVSNAPYIIFVDATNNVNAAMFNGTAWVIVGQQDFLSGTYPRLAISSAGVPYVVARSNVGNISVSKFDGANWVQVGPAAFASVAFFYTDITIDATGVPYVVSSIFTTTYKNSVLKFNGTGWVNVGAAGFTTGSSAYAQLKFNSSGSLHLVYTDLTNGTRASLMKFDGANWVAVGAANFSSGVATTPSIGFDSFNAPHVGYGDGSFSNAATVLKLCSSTASIISTTPGAACGSGAIALSATGNTANLKWYNTATAQVGTGGSFTTPTLTSTTPYFVAAYDLNGCSSVKSNVVASIVAPPTILSSNGGGVCEGTAAQISATVSAGTVSWYSVPSGGSALATNVTSGSLFTTAVLNTATTFYAEAVNNGCVSASRTAVTPVFHLKPSNPVSLGGSRCGTGAVSISVSADPGTVQWFTAAIGGTLLQASGSTYITPSISVNTTYYANVTSLVGCVSSERTPVLASILLKPTITTTIPASRCGDGTVTLSAATSGDASAQWFTAATGGTALSTSKTFVTPSISATTTYYVEALENGCPSNARSAVVATVNPIPTITTSDGSRCGDGTVTLAASSDGDISWFATNTGGTALTTGTNFTTPALTATTSYFLESILNGCTTPTRTSISAAINPIPAMPTISANNTNPEVPILTSSSSNGNQWFKDDVIISGANSNTYTIAQAGTYKVQVTLLGCSSPISDGLAYVITGIEEFSSGSVQFYPNPAREELVVNLKAFEINKPVTITVMDLLGRMHYNASANGGDQARIDIRTYPSGNYVLLLQQGKSRVSKTFIKSF
jgi:hypothetical protein